MFGFENLLMQAAAATTGNASLDSVLVIVSAIGIIAGIAAPYLKMYARTKTLGQYVDTFAQKTAEHEENMYRFGKAARTAVPELDGELKKYEVPLSSIEKRVVGAKDQLEYFRKKTPDNQHASSLPDLPRESVKVDLKRRYDDESSAAI